MSRGLAWGLQKKGMGREMDRKVMGIEFCAKEKGLKDNRYRLQTGKGT